MYCCCVVISKDAKTSTHGKLLISAVRVAYICFSIVLIILRDTLSSHPHIYLQLLASLFPPSTRQPSPVAVLLRQTLKLNLIFSVCSAVLDSVMSVMNVSFERTDLFSERSERDHFMD